MGDEQAVGVEAPGFALRSRRAAEGFRGDETASDAATVELSYVLQTARRTGASVGQAFDDDLAVRRDVLQQRERRGARESRLLVAFDGQALR